LNARQFKAFQRKTIGAVEKSLNKHKFNCLFPNCSAKAIGSHSQQRGGPLQSIAEDGKVYWLNDNLYAATNNKAGVLKADLRKCSISEASVFPGFCDDHDKIFTPIENGTLDSLSEEQVSLFFLRGIAYEVARKKRELLRCNLFIEAYSEVQPSNLSTIWALREGGEIYLKRDGEYYLEKAFRFILSKDYRGLRYVWQTLPYNIGVSTCTCINSHLESYIEKIVSSPESVNPTVVLNIVPLGNETHIIYSWLEEHSSENEWVLQKTSEIPELIKITNKLAVCETEDLCLRPSLWEGFSAKKREQILQCMHHVTERGCVEEEKIPNLFILE